MSITARSQRREDAAEHGALVLDLAAVRDPHARRQRDLREPRWIGVARLRERSAPTGFAPTVDDLVAVEMIDLRGPERRA